MKSTHYHHQLGEPSIASIPGMLKKTVTVNGASKVHLQ
jgi:hypothetical protein